MSEESADGYPVGLSGESSYQDAIRRGRKGQPVQVLHEADNPYDKKALVVLAENGDRLGYIPKSSWLRDAVHDEGKGCRAAIRSVERGGKGLYGVVIEVRLDSDGVDECDYRP